MKNVFLIVFLLSCFACNVQKKDVHTVNKSTAEDAPVMSITEDREGTTETPVQLENTAEMEDAIEMQMQSENISTYNDALVLKELTAEFLNSIGFLDDFPMGNNFWDLYNEYKTQFDLSNNESNLLGTWVNTSYYKGPYQSFTFFPNKFFIISFNNLNNKYFRLMENENIFYNRAFGTWEIVGTIVSITFYTISIENAEKAPPHNKDVSLIIHPYTVDLININDISEEGFTKRPINDTILSEELQSKITKTEPIASENLYVRNSYGIGYGSTILHHNFFFYFPDMVRENRSGLEIATNPELIRKYISDWLR